MYFKEFPKQEKKVSVLYFIKQSIRHSQVLQNSVESPDRNLDSNYLLYIQHTNYASFIPYMLFDIFYK